MAFYHFLVLGEEKRQYYLAQMLKKEGHEVMEAMSYQPGYHDAILLPVPQTAMFFEENKEKFQKGQVVYGCKFSETAIDYAKESGQKVMAIRLVPLTHQKIQCQNMILFLIPYRHRFLQKSGCRE